MKNATAGTAAAANIQRQPFCALKASSQFTRYESRMPVTMVIWFSATSLPRLLAGATSAM